MSYEIIVIGTSWGGLAALRKLTEGLPPYFGIPIVIVQHRNKQSDHLLAALLKDRTTLAVRDVDDKARIMAGSIYIAPADYHLLIEDGCFALSLDEPVNHSRPSIDVTFISAAETYGARSVGVVLTGANADGAQGLKRIHDRGGLTLVQDPATAESPIMPAAAIRCVPQARVLSIADICRVLAALPAPAVDAHHQRAR